MIDILTDMLKLSKEYADTNSDESVESFIEWLCYKNKLQKPTKKTSNSSLIFALNKANIKIKNSSKEILKSYNLTSLDDYYYLLELKKHKTLSKSILINNINHEISTGSEIIKRLLKANLLIQTVDVNDKRVKLVSLSSQAFTLLAILEDKLTDLFDKKLEYVYEEEKALFLKLLNKVS